MGMVKGMLGEFKEFALKGNAITLAIGVVMGAAFNAIINSMVTNLFNPLIGVLLGGVNLDRQTFQIWGVTFGWGAVVEATIHFVVVAIALFIVVKAVSTMDKEPDPTHYPCPFCTTDVANEASRCPACTSDLKPMSAFSEAV